MRLGHGRTAKHLTGRLLSRINHSSPPGERSQIHGSWHMDTEHVAILQRENRGVQCVRLRAEEIDWEMGCTSAKQVSAVSNGEEENSKAHSNGDLLSDEYKMKGVEQVKYFSEDGGEGDTQDCMEKNALLGTGQQLDQSESNGNEKILSIHSSESQQEFFRMLDEKIAKGRDYCSEEEDLT